MEYGMVSILIPEEYAEKFCSESKNTMQDAANALQWNIYLGLCENLKCNFPLFNILPCGSYPQYYKRPFVPKFHFSELGENLGFCNIKLIRNFSKTTVLEKALKKWCRFNGEEKVLFVYTLSQPLLSAIAGVKKTYPDLYVCAIVADLPDMSNLSSDKSFFLKQFVKHRANCSYSLISNVDSFVLLTKHMADYMHLTKPYHVMEGIVSEQGKRSEISGSAGEDTTKNEDKVILYTGTLHRKFGVMHLLEAFGYMKSPDVKLVICGVGDSEAEIRKAAEIDKRIHFLGQLRRDDVLELQTRATILVNPRLNNEKFTKYSFPSKTMEYLMSGNPVVAYKLDGIPDEYDPYITYPSDSTVEALADTLDRLCSLSEEVRAEMGQRAHIFVSEQKNRRIQTKRILNFVRESMSLGKN